MQFSPKASFGKNNNEKKFQLPYTNSKLESKRVIGEVTEISMLQKSQYSSQLQYVIECSMHDLL